MFSTKRRACVNYDYATVHTPAESLWNFHKFLQVCAHKLMALLAIMLIIVQKRKLITVERSHEVTYISPCISVSTIAIEVRLFVHNLLCKEPGGLQYNRHNVDCVFIACSVPCLRLSLWRLFFILYIWDLLWDLGFRFLTWICYTYC